MSVEDFEPRIDELTARFSRAEILIAAALGTVAAGATPQQLEQAQRRIAAILQNLLTECVAWINQTIPAVYRDGAEQAIRDMALRLPRGVFEQRLRQPAHTLSLESLAQGLLDDMAAATSNMGRDAKKTLREIGRRQLQKALARTNPIARIPDFRAELEEQGVSFVDRSGRRWKASRYARVVLLTQTASILNAGTVNTALQFGSPGVRVRDGGPGDVDEPCRVADGQAWSIAYFAAHLIEHPNCRRSGAALSPSWRGTLDRTMPGEREMVA